MAPIRQLLWVLFFTLSGCAGKAPPLAAVASPAADIEQSLFLIGDGGDPHKDGEPVLRALTEAVNQSAAPSLVVFLGDNIYPSGRPLAGSPKRTDASKSSSMRCWELRRTVFLFRGITIGTTRVTMDGPRFVGKKPLLMRTATATASSSCPRVVVRGRTSSILHRD